MRNWQEYLWTEAFFRFSDEFDQICTRTVSPLSQPVPLNSPDDFARSAELFAQTEGDAPDVLTGEMKENMMNTTIKRVFNRNTRQRGFENEEKL